MLILAARRGDLHRAAASLYEGPHPPITVLIHRTLPLASGGDRLLIFKMEFSIIALIRVFLLLRHRQEDAILIIDFALGRPAQQRGLSAQEAAAREPACCASARS
ncbi:hypothetical protein ACRAWD_21315 [Caulobacter segnis]